LHVHRKKIGAESGKYLTKYVQYIYMFLYVVVANIHRWAPYSLKG
jgi:hypothetical protein